MRLRRSIPILSATLVASLAGAADWPQWRGPQRNGISEETGLLQEWPEDGPPLVWEISGLGGGYSTPAVVGDRIYLINDKGNDNEFVHARSTSDGSEIWSTRIGNVGKPDQRPPYPGARSTPTVDGDKLYVLGSDGDFACLEAESGSIVWSKNVRAEFGGQYGEWAYSESPLVDGDLVLCTPGGKDATILALHKQSGEVAWKSAVPGGDEAAYSSIVITETGGLKQYVQFLAGGVVGVNAETGEFLWRYEKTASGSPANIPTPVVADNLVYSASGRGGAGLVKLAVQQGKVDAEEVYFDQGLPKSIGGSVLVGDYLYGTTRDGLVCAEFATGEVKWQNRSIGAASVLFADGLLFLHGEDGRRALVAATPEEYRELGRFTPDNIPDRGDSKAWAYPVLSNGRLYIHDFGTLWCYDVDAK
jgi:outer membrane protein assembly factor BamB